MPPAPAIGPPLPTPILGYVPSTFLERGVVMPYTTPHLVGARLRPGDRSGLELIVPNLSGGKGVYILGLDGIYALCAPTLHDRTFNAKLIALRGVTPGAIREAAHGVAAQGLAGRQAAKLAVAGMAAEQQGRMLAQFELLLDLLHQVEPRDASRLPPEQCDHAELGRRTRLVLNTLAPHLGRPPESLMLMLEELASLFAAIGIGRQAASARMPSMIALLEDLQTQMRLLQQAAGGAGNPEAAIVEATAAMTVDAARVTLGEARKLLSDLPRLLRRWIAEPAKLAKLVSRPEWLLDGWERICLLWRAADERIGQQVTLAEMVCLIPTTPAEANEWVETKLEIGMESVLRRRKVLLGEDWRTGVTLADLVSRNERLRAWSPGGPG